MLGPSNLDAELQRELLEHYLSSADERVAALRSATGEARANPDDAQARDALRRVAHKIAGNAGTYGFPQLTVAARELEARILAGERDVHDAAAALASAMETDFAAARATLSPAAPASNPHPHAAPASVPEEAALSVTRQRLVVAVLGSDESGAATALGAALARSGAHLAVASLPSAARAFREAAGEGLVLGFEARDRAHACVDLPLGSMEALVAASDGAALVGGDSAAIELAMQFVRAQKPVVAVPASGGAAALLAGQKFKEGELAAAADADDAVLRLLVAIGAGADHR